MTLSAESNDKNSAADTGKALAPAVGASPINPFLAAAAEDKIEAGAPPRSFVARILDYSAHVAIIVGLVGFAWTVSDHVLNRSAARGDPEKSASIPAQPTDEMAQLRLANQKMHDDIKALKASVETLRTTIRRDTTPEQVRMLSAGLDGIKGSITSTNETISQLNGKIDQLQPGKLQQLAERVGRLEHQTIDTAATGSIDKTGPAKSDTLKSDGAKMNDGKSVPTPPVKPTTLASTEDVSAPSQDGDKPQVISGWVVRDVYQGVALIEGKRGSLEVVPGVAIPGAGVVKSIERHGGGWVVTTTKGQFASAATSAQHDYRRGPYQYQRGFAPYRYDY